MHRCSSGTVAAAVVVVAFAAFAAAVFKADSIREAKETARSAYTHTHFFVRCLRMLYAYGIQ